MANIEKDIEIDVPARTAYDQWTQFEDFPKFMEGVKEVRQLDDKSLSWRAEVGGKELQWTSEIMNQEPDRRITWKSTGGPFNAGSVLFDSLAPNKCRVTLKMDYEPEGMLEKTGSALGVVSARVRGDLERFKKFLESRGLETGAWRGEIQQGKVKKRDQKFGRTG
jgi:uncharacterized membrane protein